MTQKQISLFFSSLALCLFGSFMQIASAGLPSCSVCSPPSSSSSPSSKNDNKVYAGLVWTLNHQSSYFPDLSFGWRSLKINSNNNLNGGDLNGRISFNGGLKFDSLRLSYVGGNRDIQGNLGGGYSFNQKSLLASGAIQGPYIKVGSDLMINDKSFVPYAELNSLSKPKKIANGSSACPNGSTLTSVNNIQGINYSYYTINNNNLAVGSENVSGGFTCYNIP